MAKARDIAALAGLAGLAYANRDKLFGGKKTYNEDAGDQKTSSYTGDTKKVEAKDTKDTAEASTADEGYKSNVLKALATPKAASNDKAGNQGVLPPKSLTPEVKPKPKPKPQLKPRGMTGAQNTALAKANQASADSRNVNYGNEGNRVVGEKSTPAMLPGSDPFEIFRGGKLHPRTGRPMKSGGAVKMASGGMASSASKRADGIATKGKTRGRIC